MLKACHVEDNVQKQTPELLKEMLEEQWVQVEEQPYKKHNLS